MPHQQSNVASCIVEKSCFNSECSLRQISSKIRPRIKSYNSLVKDIYGFYVDNVLRKICSLNNEEEYILPYSNISFIQSSNYDNGTFEYNLQHHYFQQSRNSSISSFAGLSSLTHQQFMSNCTPSIGSWDLAYNLDLSERIVPFVGIDPHDHTNSTCYLNSYALDFFTHGSEQILMSENGLDCNDIFQLLSNFRLLLTSITQSLKTITENECQQLQKSDQTFFRPLSIKLSDICSNFETRFYRIYK